uniref:Uncharacterized protein n=1 Tax=Trichogramma kaykai TaxID=54128 RepID=A0ABD2VUB2_9HYME
MGGTFSKNLSLAAKEIWTWCEERKLWIFASYISSKDNAIADFESRRLEPETEYELNKASFLHLCREFGDPEIDLFASLSNAKCSCYLSWKKDPGSIAVDAFTINWQKYFFYAFPPFSIILRVIRKIKHDKATGILVVLNWPSQPWYPLFKNMLVSDMIILEPKHNLIHSSSKEHHPLWQQLFLAAGILSGKLLP